MKKIFIQIVLTYLRLFARIQLLKNKPLVIGITGSAGKTSTRDAVYAVIKNKYKVKVSYKANSETGIPLNILGIAPTNFTLIDWMRILLLCPIKLLTNWEQYEIYLVEMGIDSPLPPKNMEYLLTIVRPDIGIFLNAAPMHSEPFDFLVQTKDPIKRAQEITQLIAKEKGKIVTRLDDANHAILNTDQSELSSLQKDIRAKLLSFGKKKESSVQFSKYAITKKGTEFHFTNNAKKIKVFIKESALPSHFGYTFAAALCVAISLKIDLKSAASSLEKNFKIPAGRASLLEGINGSYILDSSYNSSKEPLLDMLDLTKKLPSKRKIALLGDIRELGKVANIIHEEVAKKAGEICELIVLVGPAMKKFALPVLKKTNSRTHWFPNAFKAAEFLEKELNNDDLLLVKGSQNELLLEIAVEKLLKKPGKANEILARRGEYWDARRAELKNFK